MPAQPVMKPVDTPPSPGDSAKVKADTWNAPAAWPATVAAAPGFTLPATPGLRALTAAVRRGDEAAFADFYDRYSLRLYKQLLALSHGDEPTAREIFQTVALKLARKMEIFDEEARLWMWLTALARHAHIDHVRARRRLATRQSPLTDEPAAEAAPSRWAEAMAHALAGLAPADCELLQAAYVDARPLGALAAERGETYKAVESRLARLRLKTKTALLKFLRHENIP